MTDEPAAEQAEATPAQTPLVRVFRNNNRRGYSLTVIPAGPDSAMMRVAVELALELERQIERGDDRPR